MRKDLEKNIEMRLTGIVDTSGYKKETSTSNGKEYLKGSMSVDTPNGIVKVDFFAGKMTKAGSVSKLYTGLEQGFLDFIHGDRVSIGADFVDRLFAVDGEVKSKPTIQGKFINKPYDNSQEEAVIHLHRGIVLDSFRRHPKGTGWILPVGFQFGDNPDYLQLGVMDVVFSDEFHKEAKNLFQIGDTMSAVIDIKGITEVEEVRTPSAFGPDIVNTKNSYRVEYHVYSGSKVTGPKAYRENEVEALLANRAAMKDKELAKVKTRKTAPANSPAATPAPTPKKQYSSYL